MTDFAGRAVIYARLSRDTEKTGAGVDRQLEDARQLATLRGLTVVAEYIDNDISAAGVKRRPGFEAMLTVAGQGQAGTIIAWAWDRLERNRRDALRLIELGQQARLTVALVRGQDIDMTSAAGRMVADILASVARAEIDTKSERSRRAGLQRAVAGRPPARRAFGYGDDGSPHPVEAAVVSEVFALFLAGKTIVGISRWLNEAGHRSARGRPWEDSGVRQMLLNPRYAGERYYHGERVTVGKWQPLVQAETFEAVRAVFADPARRKRRPSRRYLGSSLYLCWCGAPTKVSYAKGGYRVYVCSARPHMTRKADPVDEVVLRVVSQRLSRPDALALTADRADAGRLVALRQQAIGQRARLDALAADYAVGNLSGRQVKVASERIEAMLEAVESELADAGRGSALASIAGAEDPGESWLRLPLDQQRAVLADIATVTLLQGRRGRGCFDEATVQVAWR